ncbi:flavin reductase [Glutamicibacter protophormiae]
MTLTASSVTSVGTQPPLLLFSVSVLSSTAGVLAPTATVVLHFLDAQDIEVTKLGATSGIDRFTQTQTWTRLESGESVYDGVRA